ncbi:hypothetical protein GCM10027440_18740 [Nocardiopsis coralliicola]
MPPVRGRPAPPTQRGRRRFATTAPDCRWTEYAGSCGCRRLRGGSHHGDRRTPRPPLRLRRPPAYLPGYPQALPDVPAGRDPLRRRAPRQPGDGATPAPLTSVSAPRAANRKNPEQADSGDTA